MEMTSVSLITWSFGLAAFGYLALWVYLISFGADWRSGVRTRRMVSVAVISTLWTVSSLFYTFSASPLALIAASLVDVAKYGAWYVFLITLLAPASNRETKPLLPSWLPAICWGLVFAGISLQFLVAFRLISPEDWLRLLVLHGLVEAVIGLVLAEQLFRTVSDDSRWNIKPLCLALLFQFAFDVYLFSDAMMFSRIDGDALAVRGFVHAITIPLLMLATERARDWTSKIRLSQKAAFHSATLLLAGLYLLFTAGVGYYVRYFGGEWGRAFQLALIFAGLLVLGVLLVSGSMRARMKVLVGKHFFRYRYDYREEWLRFTQTLTEHDSPQTMGQQVIRGLANMVESPAGALWVRETGHGAFRQSARWNLPECIAKEAYDSPLCQFLLASGWVVNLEEYRCYPARYSNLEIPAWLSDLPNAWLIVPLVADSEMQGFVILASSRTPINVNWEVNDLLRAAGCQAASFLARMQATEALLEVRKFDAFNKMSAFVVHDLKNIITQLSLMLKNAERHRDNPEFQKDMLMTVDHAVERMRQLMMQLREGAPPPGGICGVNLPDVIQRIQKDKMNQGRSIELQIQDRLIARGHEERLERVIGHLVQNAIDASPVGGRVWISLERRSDKATIEVGDTGHGMTQEFIQDRLFKPFQSTKDSGMGIGAYESAQYIRELGGDMQVESELGKGTCITLTLPLFVIRTTSDLHEQEPA
ncbi:MAG: PEP-CTERM system histidine kinase PrsK [Betaproteobacteria bacterium HGW-Betaproteobacteria-5]|jgi:putative PEP-CTERM system histidine kinase|nr:MAG: PEP-CTERM system histidine kinase PrsK [Betaproteobacteria bacterium HGW-Betaproteobacteria-5]PKO40730.1 MAG: PEP-CTERM system histidine kinase PrsK [Betaproteobacteria bacterium HGW-Betaproteobacteria-6]